jgi:hypothetical protein
MDDSGTWTTRHDASRGGVGVDDARRPRRAGRDAGRRPTAGAVEGAPARLTARIVSIVAREERYRGRGRGVRRARANAARVSERATTFQRLTSVDVAS